MVMGGSGSYATRLETIGLLRLSENYSPSHSRSSAGRNLPLFSRYLGEMSSFASSGSMRVIAD